MAGIIRPYAALISAAASSRPSRGESVLVQSARLPMKKCSAAAELTYITPPMSTALRRRAYCGLIRAQVARTVKKPSAMPTSPVAVSSGSRHAPYAPLRYASHRKSPLSPGLAGMTLRHRSPISMSSAPSAPSRQSRR